MITITDTELENNLKSLLQKNVELKIKDKVWKSGRLLLFKQSGFFIELIVQAKKQERFEIPIPFKVNINKTSVCFDYTLLSFVNNNKKLLSLVSKIEPKSKNKFYNSVLEFNIIK
jgi:hypothetical protein